jgi:hypothetical protein
MSALSNAKPIRALEGTTGSKNEQITKRDGRDTTTIKNSLIKRIDLPSRLCRFQAATQFGWTGSSSDVPEASSVTPESDRLAIAIFPCAMFVVQK